MLYTTHETEYTKTRGFPLAGTKADVGGKGHFLLDMSSTGFPVPQALVIPTEYCRAYQTNTPLQSEVMVWDLVDHICKVFGQDVLLSVRSGAPVSMPGMMDTILNVGISIDRLYDFELAPSLAWDCTRRFYQMYGSVVLGIDTSLFENVVTQSKEATGATHDSDLSLGVLAEVAKDFETTLTAADSTFPTLTRREQLYNSIVAVFESWNTERAKVYRALHDISDEMCTAVVIQEMVFGNKDAESCSGVMFSRDPTTGENVLTGEYLPVAQGEDVVSGARTPLPLAALNSGLFLELKQLSDDLEESYKDMQDIEFTVESGVLYVLQTRAAKRSAKAAFKVAEDMVTEGLITPEVARGRLTAPQFLSLRETTVLEAPDADHTGIGASTGVVSGVAAFNIQDMTDPKVPYILVAKETNPEGFPAMVKSMGLVCVVGTTDLCIEAVAKGDPITLCGETGRVWLTDAVVTESAELPLDTLTKLFPDMHKYSIPLTNPD